MRTIMNASMILQAPERRAYERYGEGLDRVEPADTSEFALLLDSYDFLRLETIARLAGLDKKMSDLGRAYQNHRVSERLLDDPKSLSSLAKPIAEHKDGTVTYEMEVVDGSDDPMVAHFREMIRIGGKGAILSLYHSDRPKLLNLARQYASGALGPYKRVLETDTLKRHGYTRIEEAVAEYRAVFQAWIPILEAAVQSMETLNAIASYGVHLDKDGASVAVTSPKGGFLRRPREFLAEWGSAYLRLSMAEKLIAKGATAAGYLDPDAYDPKSLDRRLINNVQGQLIAQLHDDGSTDAANQRDSIDALVFAVCWVIAGLPVVQASHRLAASLMATSVPAEALPEVVVPWQCFLVEVPDGLLGPESPLHDMAYIGLIADREEHDQQVVYLFLRDAARPMVMPISSISDLSALSTKLVVTRQDAELAMIQRSLDLLGRYLLGALIELDDVEHKQKIVRGPGQGALDPKHRSGTPPTSWIFQIKRDVKVDVRPYVREYVSRGGGKSLALQRLVRGHSKRQPYGPRGSLRKWIHIEPYWQGPEDAPIALRKHKVV